jgi:hypothetical protein
MIDPKTILAALSRQQFNTLTRGLTRSEVLQLVIEQLQPKIAELRQLGEHKAAEQLTDELVKLQARIDEQDQ